MSDMHKIDLSFITDGEPIGDWDRLAAEVWLVAKNLTPDAQAAILKAELANLRKEGIYTVLAVNVGRSFSVEEPHFTGMRIVSMAREIARVCDALDADAPDGMDRAAVMAQIAKLRPGWLTERHAAAEERRAVVRQAAEKYSVGT